ncbi:hypothetical protein FGRMN_2891 [Fusarium graminum]|nr:hypothetical protein FGRMN_2891 [Fusarium graminum]
MACSGDPIDTSRAPEFISFGETGDLWLIVGSGQQSSTFLVDSHALCRTSRVFRSMLRNGFMESKPQGQDHWEVKLPEDKALPFIILMDIIHNEFERTPVEINVQDLYHICTLTNKYDMTKVLRPMAGSWQKRLKDDRSGVCVKHWSKRLFAAWELGCWETVEEMFFKIAACCSVNEDVDLVYAESSLLEELKALELLPLIDLVAEQRSRILGVFKARCKIAPQEFCPEMSSADLFG